MQALSVKVVRWTIEVDLVEKRVKTELQKHKPNEMVKMTKMPLGAQLHYDLRSQSRSYFSCNDALEFDGISHLHARASSFDERSVTMLETCNTTISLLSLATLLMTAATFQKVL